MELKGNCQVSIFQNWSYRIILDGIERFSRPVDKVALIAPDNPWWNWKRLHSKRGPKVIRSFTDNPWWNWKPIMNWRPINPYSPDNPWWNWKMVGVSWGMNPSTRTMIILDGIESRQEEVNMQQLSQLLR